MRLLKLGIYHPTYLNDFYARRPGLAREPYLKQQTKLIDDFFGSSDFWTRALTRLGYQTVDIIANAAPMQAQWATENNIEFDVSNWLSVIGTAQIKKFKPDILLVADYSVIKAEFLRHLRRECPSIRLVLGWCGAPWSDPAIFNEWDIALTCVPELVERFRILGLQSYHVNHAFDPRVAEHLTTSREQHDFVFVGSIVKRDGFHVKREELLASLARTTDLEIWADVQRPVSKADSSALGTAVAKGLEMFRALGKTKQRSETGPGFNEIDTLLIQRSKPAVFGREMFQTLRDSRVVFNNHIDISTRNASNMRLFEATGVGSCLLTDRKDNLADLFAPDVEVVSYDSAEECAEKVRYLLENEIVRRSIAEAGHKRTLRDHTFERRAGCLDEIIRTYFHTSSSPQ